jgi:hypothetical protein
MGCNACDPSDIAPEMNSFAMASTRSIDTGLVNQTVSRAVLPPDVMSREIYNLKGAVDYLDHHVTILKSKVSDLEKKAPNP